MADIFISYAHEESDVAHRLRYLFECEDWSSWWDKPSVKLGQDFRPLVAQAIEEARLVLVLWSAVSLDSAWVRWEVERARLSRKLLEFAVQSEQGLPGRKDGLFEIPTHPHIPPVRDEVLRRVAEEGHLVRRSDLWNSSLSVSNRNRRPPKHPVIGWEWVNPGTDRRRLVRRERWGDGNSVVYGTTIGNAWMFGEEDSCVPIGYIYITQDRHTVQLPEPPRERNRPFVTPFNIDVRITEFMQGIYYPDGGVDLADSEFNKPSFRG